MIRRIYEKEELYSALDKFKPDILRGKIKSLEESYGFKYPFLKFFVQTDLSAVIAVYYDSAVVLGKADEETALFLETEFGGEVLTSAENEKIFGSFSYETLYIMEYTGIISEKTALRTDLSYEKVYEILKEGFDIPFDDWYTDTCHRVRHGISRIYTIEDKATATEIFSVDGISLITLVAVKKAYRKSGLGGMLVKSLSEKLKEKGKIFVICEKSLIPFYEKNGYKLNETCIRINMMK